MKIFYHNDSDGKCAAFLANFCFTRYHKDYEDGYDGRIETMDYHKPFPIDAIMPDERVYILDYSIHPNEMDKLLEVTKNVIWIDHHKTAIEKYADYPHEIGGIRYDGVSGCMLTWCYLFSMTNKGHGDVKPFEISMVKEAPMFVKLIDDWDVWKFEFGDRTRYFQMAFNAYDFHPLSATWNKFVPLVNKYSDENKSLDEPSCESLIQEGEIMTRFRDGWAKSYCKSRGFELEFEGHKCFAINLGQCNSEYFNSVDKDKYDILIPFSFNGSNWLYSMYSTTVDVSEIAKKHGGGGHKGAAGFTSDELLLRKKS